MVNVNVIKWVGLVGAVLTGAAQILAGDWLSGGGVISAALSSAGILAKGG